MEKFDSLVDYCLNCLAKPCKKGCPLGNDIPSFIKAAKDGKFLDAFNILSETTVLAAICGRICPFRQLCEKNCIRSLKGEPVQIGKIEAYIGDKFLESDYPLFSNVLKDNGKKVAIVGAGPAGLSCAAFLRKLGYDVTIFEKYNYVGGIISHGIPSFRLSKEIALKNFSKIMDLGIKICFNKELGRNISVGKLRRKYDAVFLSFGASAACFVTWNCAVNILGALKTSIYIYAIPVITIVTSVIILHEKITPMAIIGTILTLMGLLISESKIPFIKFKEKKPQL